MNVLKKTVILVSKFNVSWPLGGGQLFCGCQSFSLKLDMSIKKINKIEKNAFYFSTTTFNTKY